MRASAGSGKHGRMSIVWDQQSVLLWKVDSLVLQTHPDNQTSNNTHDLGIPVPFLYDGGQSTFRDQERGDLLLHIPIDNVRLHTFQQGAKHVRIV
jgi:hypothetical protein